MTTFQIKISDVLVAAIAPLGFERDEKQICRLWNNSGTICCAIAPKKFTHSDYYTVEIGFICPTISSWQGVRSDNGLKPDAANLYGVLFRMEQLDIKQGYIFPPGGWQISKHTEFELFAALLRDEFVSKLQSSVHRLMSIEGWINYFRNEVTAFDRGRGTSWSLLGYSMLACPSISNEEIEQVINAHASQDGSIKYQNKIEMDVQKQRALLRKRMPGDVPPQF